MPYKDKAANVARNKAYHEANKEKIRARRKAYHEANKEKILANRRGLPRSQQRKNYRV